METDLTVPVIEKIQKLADAASAKENRVIELDLGGGVKKFDAQNLRRIYDDPRPATIEVSSLSAIADYLNSKLEGVDLGKVFLHVVSPEEVELLAAYSGEENKRTRILVAKRDNDAEAFRFDEFYETEAFVIGLMSLFEPTDDRATILKVASALVSESKIAKTDSGATAKLQVNAGVVNTSEIQDKDIPYVAILKPFRTFREVEQPSSAFVFRYKAIEDKVGLKLIEADGGAWKHDAMVKIAVYFETEVKGLKVIA
jgi:hypothetical protein